MKASTRSILGAGLVGAAVAGVLSLVVFALAKAGDVSFGFVQFGRQAEVGYGMVALNAIGAVVIGAALAALLGTRRLRLMQIVGAAVAVLSTVGPLSLTGAASGKAVLVALHLLTGLVFVAALEVARRRSVTDVGVAVPPRV
jgi:hypothetical protein